MLRFENRMLWGSGRRLGRRSRRHSCRGRPSCMCRLPPMRHLSLATRALSISYGLWQWTHSGHTVDTTVDTQWTLQNTRFRVCKEEKSTFSEGPCRTVLQISCILQCPLLCPLCVHCVPTVCPLCVHCKAQAKLEGAALDKQKSYRVCGNSAEAVQRTPDTHLQRLALKAWL